MKLYNQSHIPDDVLYGLLVSAGRAVGARTSGVVVLVRDRSHYLSGNAPKEQLVDKQYFLGLRGDRGRQVVESDGGMICLRFLKPSCVQNTRYTNYFLSTEFFKLAMHEWAHIRDYQEDPYMTRPWSFRLRTPSGRLVRWGNRPEEVRAIQWVEEAIEGGVFCDSKVQEQVEEFEAWLKKVRS